LEHPQSQRERRALGRVHRLQAECLRLVGVPNDFLRFARVNDLDRKPADLREVVEEMVDFFGPMARAGNVEIKCYLPGDLPPVALDRDLFKQALLNLMLNAEQAMAPDEAPAGGAAAGPGGQLTVQAAREPGGGSLSFIDTRRG